MKKPLFLLLIVLTTATGLASCAQNSQDHPMPKGGSVSGASAGTISIKYPGGYASVPIGDIVSIEITLLPPIMNPEDSNMTRTISGPMASKIAAAAGLDQAQETGRPSATKTGQLTLSFKTAANEVEVRGFDILNNRILEDATYPDVTYHADEILDRYWLDGLPEGAANAVPEPR